MTCTPYKNYKKNEEKGQFPHPEIFIEGLFFLAGCTSMYFTPIFDSIVIRIVIILTWANIRGGHSVAL